MDHIAGLEQAQEDVRITTICDVDLNVTGRAQQGDRAALWRRRRRSSRTSAGCSTTSRSTRSRSPRPTTGTPWRRSGPARPARTSTSRSRSATTSPKAGGWSRPPGSTTGSSRPARNAAATRASRTRSRSSARASSARSTWPRGSATSRAARSGTSPTARSPTGVDYDLWLGPGAEAAVQPQPLPLQLALDLGLRQRRPRQPGHPPDGPGPLGPGQERVPQGRDGLGRPVRLLRRRPDAQHPASSASSSTTASSSSRSAGCSTNDELKVKIGDIFYGTEGILAITSYEDWQVVLRPQAREGPRRQGRRRPLRQLRQGRQGPRPQAPERRHRRGPPLQRLLPPGQHRLPAGPQAAHQPLDRVVRQRFRGRRHAHPRVPGTVRRADQGVSASRTISGSMAEAWHASAGPCTR